MSTIDPSLIDPTKPSQGEASTANVRANEAATQTNFTRAKSDIEGLETGKEDTGTAAAEVAAHDASGVAHGGVESAFAAHDGAGGSTHPAATGATAGFLSSTDKTKLDGVDPGANDYTHPNHTGDVTSDGDGAQTIAANAVVEAKIANNAVTNAKAADMPANTLKGRAATGGDPTDIDPDSLPDGGTPGAGDKLIGKKSGGDLVSYDGANIGGGGAGTYNQATKDGASISTGRAILEFRDTGDATVTVTDDAGGNRTIVEVNASAAGGGISKGDPFTLGQILEVSSTSGTGEAQSSGETASGLRTDIDSKAAQTALDGHTGDGTIHFTQAEIDHAVILNRGTNTHAQIDTHIGDGSVHYAQSAIDHTVILNRGTNTHAQIDTHIAATNNPHSVTAAQAGAAPLSHVGDTGAAHGVATGAVNGFLSSGDKTKLDGIASGAQTGDVIQGTGGSDGEVAVWQDFGGKLVHGTGIPSTAVLRNETAATVVSAIGYAATSTALTAVANIKPEPLGGNFRELGTQVGAVTVDAMTETGYAVWRVDFSAVTLDTSAFTTVGAAPAGIGLIQFVNVGVSAPSSNRQVATYLN